MPPVPSLALLRTASAEAEYLHAGAVEPKPLRATHGLVQLVRPVCVVRRLGQRSDSDSDGLCPHGEQGAFWRSCTRCQREVEKRDATVLARPDGEGDQ